MAKIYQLKSKDWKSKTWYASFRDSSGKRVQKCLGVTNKKEAQEMLDAIMEDVARGKFNLPFNMSQRFRLNLRSVAFNLSQFGP